MTFKIIVIIFVGIMLIGAFAIMLIIGIKEDIEERKLDKQKLKERNL